MYLYKLLLVRSEKRQWSVKAKEAIRMLHTLEKYLQCTASTRTVIKVKCRYSNSLHAAQQKSTSSTSMEYHHDSWISPTPLRVKYVHFFQASFCFWYQTDYIPLIRRQICKKKKRNGWRVFSKQTQSIWSKLLQKTHLHLFPQLSLVSKLIFPNSKLRSFCVVWKHFGLPMYKLYPPLDYILISIMWSDFLLWL